MYKQATKIKDEPIVSVIRTIDGACIPFDPDNTDYQEYLKWVAEGGVPTPAENT